MLLSPANLEAAFQRVASRRRGFGSPLVRVAEVESTNDLAATLAARGASEGTVVLADAQTRGRGRLGRPWHSPAGAGLYVSIIFRPSVGRGPESRLDTVRFLTLAGGVAVAESVRAVTGLPVEIKWPNDLVIGRPWRKLGGLLAEASTVAGRIEHVVLGVGLNLAAAAFPAELAGRVTSIEEATGRSVDGSLVLAEMLAALAERYADLQAGRARRVLDRWRSLSPSATGSHVAWDTGQGIRRGRTEGIDDSGALIVRVGDATDRIVSGEVRWISIQGVHRHAPGH